MRRTSVIQLVAAMVAIAVSGSAVAKDEDSPLQLMLKQQEKIDRMRQPVVPDTPAPVHSGHGYGYSSVPLQRTYCVRTCDGYYFAIGMIKTDKDIVAHGDMCAASCDGAEMQMFSTPIEAVDPSGAAVTPAIERAVDANGALYTALPVAYAYRKGFTQACSCRSTASGLPRIPLSADPTLRDGDIVVTPDGLKVFKGDRAAPHAETEFVPVNDSRALSSVVREQMLSLQNRIAQ